MAAAANREAKRTGQPENRETGRLLPQLFLLVWCLMNSDVSLMSLLLFTAPSDGFDYHQLEYRAEAAVVSVNYKLPMDHFFWWLYRRAVQATQSTPIHGHFLKGSISKELTTSPVFNVSTKSSRTVYITIKSGAMYSELCLNFCRKATYGNRSALFILNSPLENIIV